MTKVDFAKKMRELSNSKLDINRPKFFCNQIKGTPFKCIAEGNFLLIEFGSYPPTSLRPKAKEASISVNYDMVFFREGVMDIFIDNYIIDNYATSFEMTLPIYDSKELSGEDYTRFER